MPADVHPGPRAHLTPPCVRRLFCGLVAVELCLVAIHVAAGQPGHPMSVIHRLFDLDAEGNIPAWFSTVQLFLLGLVFLGMRGRAGTGLSSRLSMTAGAGFIFLSMDEAASIHESITAAFTPYAWLPRFQGDHGMWLFLYLPAGLAALLAFRRDLAGMWARHPRTAATLLAGLLLYVMGGGALEVVSYQYLRSGTVAAWLYCAEVALEEFLEMAGISVMLYGALRMMIPGRDGSTSC